MVKKESKTEGSTTICWNGRHLNVMKSISTLRYIPSSSQNCSLLTLIDFWLRICITSVSPIWLWLDRKSEKSLCSDLITISDQELRVSWIKECRAFTDWSKRKKISLIWEWIMIFIRSQKKRKRLRRKLRRNKCKTKTGIRIRMKTKSSKQNSVKRTSSYKSPRKAHQRVTPETPKARVSQKVSRFLNRVLWIILWRWRTIRKK